MDPILDRKYMWIAREGLKAPLPDHWKAVYVLISKLNIKPTYWSETEDGEIYYFNFKSGESLWDHPCDKYYKNLFQEEKKKDLKSGLVCLLYFAFAAEIT